MKSRYAKEKTFQPSTTTIYPNVNNTNPEFAKSYNWLLRRKELSPGAKHTYNRLTQYAGAKNYARVKQETLALETGVSARQIRRDIEELEHFALIKVQQIGLNKANLYYFLEHPWRHERQKPSNSKQLHPVVNTQDTQIPDRPHMAGQERPHMAGQERSDMTGQERPDMAGPLKRSSEKIQLKEHTQKRGSVCVSSPKTSPSEYSKEQWDKYAKAQKGVHSPEGLADSLSRSKENDYLMKKFLESQDKDKTTQSLKLEQDTQRQLKVAQDMQDIITTTLASANANEPLLPWQIQLLESKGYSLPHQKVS